MLLNDAKRPFGSRALNETESIAIFVQCVTIYCGLFYISRVESKDDPGYDPATDFFMTKEVEYTFLFTIVAFNIFFIFVWLIKFV